MKKLTVRPRLGKGNILMIERLIGSTFPKNFSDFMAENAGLSHYECFFSDQSDNVWEVSQFNQFKDLYGLTKEFKEGGWGLKVPFAFDPGGWHFCLSFDAESFGKIIVNRWTDHSPEDQFVVIADSFEEFINGLERDGNNTE